MESQLSYGSSSLGNEGRVRVEILGRRIAIFLQVTLFQNFRRTTDA